MRRWPLFATALLIGTGGAGGGLASTAWAGTSPIPPQANTPHAVSNHEVSAPGKLQVLRLDPTTVPPQAQMRREAAQNFAALPITAKINVTYLGFSPQARVAFQAAVNIWQTQIHSTVPIDVVADWSNLTKQYNDAGILGAAGPTSFLASFHGAPDQNAFYPIALANAITGIDQRSANVCNTNPGSSFADTSGAEITASFNSDQAAWYYGTDGHPAAGQVDLESVVLHELGHGLGFVGTFDSPVGGSFGSGVFGLYGDGTEPTIFDSFVTDGFGHPLLTDYQNETQQLGDALRGQDGGLEWNGAAGDAAAAGAPQLYAPDPFEEGSSFSHLDEATYPASGANALMTPALHFGEVEHSVGPIVLGMFQDMGWPQTGSPAPTTIGDYHVAAPMRLVTQAKVTNSAPLHVTVAGVDGLPASGLKAVAVNVAVQVPTRAGIWSTLPNCGGPTYPDSQNFQLGQTRSTQSILPVEDDGTIEVSLTASPAAAMSGLVSVDLVGWYGAGGVAYHPLAQKQAFSLALTPTPVDLKILGVAGVPTSGVTAVALSAGVGFMTTPGFLLVGPGGINSIVPTVSYQVGDFTQNLAVVPLGTGAWAGKIRVRVNAGRAAVALYVVGWYGPSASGGLNFHPAGPVRLSGAPHGQDITIGGLPSSTPVMLDIHLANPTANGSLSVAPGGSTALALTQEFKAKQGASGITIVTTNASGQVRMRLSGAAATFYTDFEGWFST